MPVICTCNMVMARSILRVSGSWPWAMALLRVRANLVRAVQVGFLLAGHERVGLGGELAFVEDNFKHAFPARISHGTVEHVNQQLAELAQRVGLVRAFRLLGEGFHGQTMPFGHGDEDVVLVLEMPVDRTTGDAPPTPSAMSLRDERDIPLP